MHARASFLQNKLHPKPPVKPRARLAVTDIIKIFEIRGCGVQATSVANMYGVSEKAIRDIWTARTWARETWHLEPSREVVLKQAGRPKGSTDSRPRRIKNIDYRVCKRQPVCNSFQSFKKQSRSSAELKDDAQSPRPCAVQPKCAGGYDLEAPAPPSLDEQLGAWDLGACSPASWDPFEQDWERARAGFALCAVFAAKAV